MYTPKQGRSQIDLYLVLVSDVAHGLTTLCFFYKYSAVNVFAMLLTSRLYCKLFNITEIVQIPLHSRLWDPTETIYHSIML